jgi:serine/threonine-protein kinase
MPSPLDKSKSSNELPTDLLPVIKKSGILADRQFDELRNRVLAGELPFEPKLLATKLVRDKVLTEYQARRFLGNKSHGLMVGKYVIHDRLGSGSMGRVYKAQHQLMGRLVALKIIAPEIVTNQRVVARFQREMRMVGRLDHPNVVRAFDADQAGNILYIVMEYVSGQSLGQRYRSSGPLSPVDVVNYAAQAALGLAHAHDQGIVHRDIKPSNLLLSEDLTIKVLDLGLGVLMEADEQSSFATADGIAVGTIDYMSPEQALGREVDGRSDLYSLGCSMYHLISGRLPFPGDTPVDRLGKRIGGRPTPILNHIPDLPSPLVQVLDRLLATRPQDRYQSAKEAAEALQGLIRKKPGPSARVVSEPSPPPPAAPPPPPQVITVSPDYARWFRPLASFALASPHGALAMLVGLSLVLFGAGFVTAMMMR